MKSKIRGNKKIAYAIVGAGAVALCGTAFSSWVIANVTGTNNSDNPIDVSVAQVQDRSMTATAVVDDGTIRFDADPEDNSGLIHYGSDDGSGEDLSFSITVTVTNAVSSGAFATYFGGFDVYMDVTGNASDTFKEYKDNKIVFPLSISSSQPTHIAAAESLDTANSSNVVSSTETDARYNVEYSVSDSTSLVAKMTFNFGWGTDFGNVNPCYYDGDASSASIAREFLNDIQAANENVKLTIYIVPVLKN